MIELNELMNKYGEYGVNEDKLKEILIYPKPKSVWDLKYIDNYYWINDKGAICASDWLNKEIDIARRAIGNCFFKSRRS